jgi:phosphoribosylaminoimidazole-succinocarboxamide synthase
MILGEHAIAFGWASAAELEQIDAMALKVDGILSKFLDERGVMLIDFKLEFGRHHGEILLGDEICPDTCRFWDKATRQKLDKDRFRHDLGGVQEAYHEMLRRVEN